MAPKKRAIKIFCCKQRYESSKQETPSSISTLLRLIYQKSDGRYVLSLKSPSIKSFIINLLTNPPSRQNFGIKVAHLDPPYNLHIDLNFYS